jgi:hypothetical protein
MLRASLLFLLDRLRWMQGSRTAWLAWATWHRRESAFHSPDWNAMKIAALSDIHGNLAALDAVLHHIRSQGADVIVNLGDIVSGPLLPALMGDWSGKWRCGVGGVEE